MWWHMPLIPAFGKLKQEDFPRYIVQEWTEICKQTLSQKITTNKQNIKQNKVTQK